VTLTLDAIRDCLEGVVPSAVATCAADGTPNVAYLSQVEYVDRDHVALSFQFFNKTRRNVLENPRAVVGVIHPSTATVYRLRVRYLRTETVGPLFERMRAKLASIASYTGMSEVFRLLGSDVYRVEAIEHVSGPRTPPTMRGPWLAALRAISDDLAAAKEVAGVIDALLDGLGRELAIEHASMHLLDAARGALYTVGSRGYGASGVGSELPLGAGTIGVAAAHRTPIRLTHVTAEYAYGRGIRERLAADPELAHRIETEIPLPGLAASRSQLAAPIEVGGALLGVIFVESAQEWRFSYADEDMLVVLARQVGAALREVEGDVTGVADDRAVARPRGSPTTTAANARTATIRHYAEDDSVFVDGDYLIKGVAGAILWKLVREHTHDGREQFTNRELRLDRTLGLPEIADNLEARLVLLDRRLRERDVGLRIEKTGRGRFRLLVARPLELVDVPRPAR